MVRSPRYFLATAWMCCCACSRKLEPRSTCALPTVMFSSLIRFSYRGDNQKGQRGFSDDAGPEGGSSIVSVTELECCRLSQPQVSLTRQRGHRSHHWPRHNL